MKRDLETMHLGMVQSARDNVITAIKCREDLVEGTADSVAPLFAQSEWAPGNTSDSIASAVTNGAICAAIEMGANLNSITHGILLGAVRGNAELRAPFNDAIRQTSIGALRVVVGFDGDVAAAISGLVAGAQESADSNGVDRVEAAAAATDGAMCGSAPLVV